ncbi:MAG: hypothetical protein ACFE95_13400 [Candidatus Hodarchaeota archaeon]
MIDDLIKILGQCVGNNKQNYVKSITLENDRMEKISINGHSKEFTIEEFGRIGFQEDLFKDQK